MVKCPIGRIGRSGICDVRLSNSSGRNSRRQCSRDQLVCPRDTMNFLYATRYLNAVAIVTRDHVPFFRISDPIRIGSNSRSNGTNQTDSIPGVGNCARSSGVQSNPVASDHCIRSDRTLYLNTNSIPRNDVPFTCIEGIVATIGPDDRVAESSGNQHSANRIRNCCCTCEIQSDRVARNAYIF